MVELNLYEDQPGRGARTLASIGICDLDAAHGGTLGQEIVFGAASQVVVRDILDFFSAVLSNIISQVHRQPLMQGDVVALNGPFVPGAPQQDLLVEIPMYFPESFWQTAGPDPVTIEWLIPLYPEEARLAAQGPAGHSNLMDRIVRLDPYLFDPNRSSVATESPGSRTPDIGTG